MKILYNFFECNFCQTFGFEDLDWILDDFKKSSDNQYFLEFIRELHLIKTKKLYSEASEIMKTN